MVMLSVMVQKVTVLGMESGEVTHQMNSLLFPQMMAICQASISAYLTVALCVVTKMRWTLAKTRWTLTKLRFVW